MSANYNHMMVGTLKSSVLIEIRNAHTAKIAEELVHTGIVPNEYLDKLLRIDMMNQLKTPPTSGFDNLQRIDSVRIPLQQWCFLDATILHSIENIQGRRVAIQVSFDCDPFGVF